MITKTNSKTNNYILFGHDDFLNKEALDKLIASLGDQEALATNTVVLDGQKFTIAELKSVCDTLPFLGTKRLVLVEGFLSKYNPPLRNRGTRSRDRTVVNKADLVIIEKLIEYMPIKPDTTVLVFTDGDLDKSNPALTKLTNYSTLIQSPVLKDRNLERWIVQRIGAAGGSIAPEAVRELAILVESNLWNMSQEIEKLVLYVSGRRIETDDVKLLVEPLTSVQIFDAVDAIVRGEAQSAINHFHKLLQQGASTSGLFGLITYQFRTLTLARELLDSRQDIKNIGEALGISSEYRLGRIVQQARKYNISKLENILSLLLRTDRSIKQGQFEETLALEILILDLCRL